MAIVRDSNYRAIYTITKAEEKLILSVAKLDLPSYDDPQNTPIGLGFLIKNIIKPIMRKNVDDQWTDVLIKAEKVFLEVTYFIDDINPTLESLLIDNDGYVKEWYVYR